jgi:SAM-dependent methyltransferase
MAISSGWRIVARSIDSSVSIIVSSARSPSVVMGWSEWSRPVSTRRWRVPPSTSAADVDSTCPCSQASAERLSLPISRGMLEATPTGPWVKIVADVERLPFIDAGFDVILANHMLYHAPDVGSAVSELRRVLRPGGTLLATTNADGNFSELYELLAEAASMVLGRRVERLTPADERFTVESGSKRLAERFSDVSIRRTSGQLVIDSDESLDALRAYYRSTDDEWSSRYDIDWRVFEPALEQVLVERMRTAGEIRITTSSGILMAT